MFFSIASLTLAIFLVYPIVAVPLLHTSVHSAGHIKQRRGVKDWFKSRFGGGRANGAGAHSDLVTTPLLAEPAAAVKVAKRPMSTKQKAILGGAIALGMVGAGAGAWGLWNIIHKPGTSKATESTVHPTTITDEEEKELIAWAEAEPADEEWIINYVNQLTGVDQARKDRIIAAVKAATTVKTLNQPRSVPSIESLDDAPADSTADVDQQWGLPHQEKSLRVLEGE